MSIFAGCWSCGAHGPCQRDCECAKCVDPDDYANWIETRPEQYEAWLDRQHVDQCECPSCL